MPAACLPQRHSALKCQTSTSAGKSGRAGTDAMHAAAPVQIQRSSTGVAPEEMFFSDLTEAARFLARKEFSPLPPFSVLRRTVQLTVHGGHWPVQAAISLRRPSSKNGTIRWSYHIKSSVGLELSGRGKIKGRKAVKSKVWAFVEILTTAASVARGE